MNSSGSKQYNVLLVKIAAIGSVYSLPLYGIGQPSLKWRSENVVACLVDVILTTSPIECQSVYKDMGLAPYIQQLLYKDPISNNYSTKILYPTITL